MRRESDDFLTLFAIIIVYLNAWNRLVEGSLYVLTGALIIPLAPATEISRVEKTTMRLRATREQ